MRKQLLFIAFIVVAIVSFHDIQSNNAGRIGSAGDPGQNSCATSGCHDDFATQAGNSRVSVMANGVLVDNSFEYNPGQLYNMVISLQNPSAKTGFSFTALLPSNNDAGTLSNPDQNTQINTLLTNNRTYAYHSNAAGVASFEFSWTAPVAEDSVIFFANMNKANANLNTSGDSVFVYQQAVVADTSVQTSVVSRLDMSNSITELVIPSVNGVLSFSMNVAEPDYFSFSIYSTGGKKIALSAPLLYHSGKHTIVLSLPEDLSFGMYFLEVTTKTSIGVKPLLISN